MVITHNGISFKTRSDHVNQSYKPKCHVWFKNTAAVLLMENILNFFSTNKLFEYIGF